jgi:adenosyl cobinamide kinase/adenosyl cobinamide phosphate guanylyltransferase
VAQGTFVVFRALARIDRLIDNARMLDASAPELDLVFLIGGVRAGKSARAVELATAHGGRGVLFVATAEGLDDEMRRRIAIHKSERPSEWETLESPLELAADIDRRLVADGAQFSAVIVDCLTLWVSNVLMTLGETDDAEALLDARAFGLIDTMRAHTLLHAQNGATVRRWIVVSNEVGLGIVPSTALGRRYRDALGRVNRIVAAAASNATLMVAGLDVPLKAR